jgi:hypothetical protein
MKNNSGQTLVLVLFIITTFAATIVTLASLTTRELEMREIDESATMTYYAADSGYERARYVLKGSALKFNGSTDFISFTGDNLNTTSRTIEAWVRTKDTRGIIISKHNAASPWPGFAFGIGGNTTNGEVGYWGGSPGGSWHFGGKVNDGKWHYIAVTHSGTTCSFYIDGIPKTTTNCGSATISNNSGLIGKEDIDGASDLRFFEGTLDEIRIYAQALSDDVILNHYRGDYSSDSTYNILLMHHFEEGPTCHTGACLTDDSLNLTNNGTPTGFTDLSEYDVSESGWTRNYPNSRGFVVDATDDSQPQSCPDSKLPCSQNTKLANDYSYSVTVVPQGAECDQLFCITAGGKSSQ